MRYIKSFLTGTTLVAASTTGIIADPPKELRLIPRETVPHPVFGKIKVISHKEDIQYYNEHGKREVVEDFMKYVLNNSYTEYGIDGDNVKDMLNRIAVTKGGKAALEVITANYMREYKRIKQFCELYKGGVPQR